MSLALAFALVLIASHALADDPRAAAANHFRVGIELVDHGAWDSALAEFTRSRELFPTASALKNAAVCLRELGRFDEALDTYDDLLAHFGQDLGDADRKAVNADVARLDRFVGALSIASDPPGAIVLVDGRARGSTPMAALRVSVGAHSVRVTKQAFASFDTRVTIASHESTHVDAKLVVVSQIGRLRVDAPAGLDVIVDGAVVGTTPWEESLAVGEHRVALRDEKDNGSPARVVVVRTDETTSVAPTIEKLKGRLRVEPTPSDASVAIDGAFVGMGSWTGDVPSGRHLVMVTSPWHSPSETPAYVSSRAPQSVRPVLEALPRAYAEAEAGIVPLYGMTGHLMTGACSDSCIGNIAVAHAGYNLTRHFSIELMLAGLGLPSETHATVAATTMSGVVGTAYVNEGTDASLIVGGVGAVYRFFERFPVTLRLSLGGGRASLSTYSVGNWCAPGSQLCDTWQHAGAVASPWVPMMMTEVRVGYRFASGLTVDAGLGLLLTYVPSVSSTQTLVSATNNSNVYVDLPARPTFTGGVGFAIPLTAAFRLEL